MAITLYSFMRALAKVESGGRWNIVSPAGALGMYQIMPANLPAWGAAAGYPNITPSQFLNSPVAQTAIAATQMQRLYAQYGDWNTVARVWLGGPKAATGIYTDRYTGMRTDQYAAAIMRYAERGEGADISKGQAGLPSDAGQPPQGQPPQSQAPPQDEKRHPVVPKKVPTETIPKSQAPQQQIPGSQDILSGMWESMGVTAVTSAGKTTSEATKEAAKTVKEGAEKLGSDVKQAEQHASQTATTIWESAKQTVTKITDTLLLSIRDLVVRSALILLGLVILAGAVLYYARG